MAVVLAISDEVSEVLHGDRLKELAPDVVLSCGDLPNDYLEYVVTAANAPLLYVPGNHDRVPRSQRQAALGVPFPPMGPDMGEQDLGPRGCQSVDGRIVDVRGLRVAGLGGSMRYSEGSYQYTESQMRRRSLLIELRARFKSLFDGKRVDILVTHAPPFEVGDDTDPAHRGFRCFHRLVKVLAPRLMVHGHIHPHGRPLRDHHIGDTQVVNAVGYRVLEVNE